MCLTRTKEQGIEKDEANTVQILGMDDGKKNIPNGRTFLLLQSMIQHMLCNLPLFHPLLMNQLRIVYVIFETLIKTLFFRGLGALIGRRRDETKNENERD